MHPEHKNPTIHRTVIRLQKILKYIVLHPGQRVITLFKSILVIILTSLSMPPG